jgi:hypothetical protein
MNVYFGWDPACRNVGWIREMLAATGSEPVPEATLDEILRSQAMAGGVGCTFYWNRPGLGRWCLYSLEIPYATGAPAWVWRPQLPDRLTRFRDLAPTLNDEPQFNVTWFWPSRNIRSSNARDATFFLTRRWAETSRIGPVCGGLPAMSLSDRWVPAGERRGQDLFSRMGLRPAVLVNHPAWIEHARNARRRVRQRARSTSWRGVLGFGLLTSDGEVIAGTGKSRCPRFAGSSRAVLVVRGSPRAQALADRRRGRCERDGRAPNHHHRTRAVGSPASRSGA